MANGSENVMKSKEKVEKVKETKKKISLNIKEDIMNKRFMLRTLRQLIKVNDKYSEDIHFDSPMGDSMVFKLKYLTNAELTLSTKGESDISLNVACADPNILDEFIHDFTLEALTILALELNLCLKASYPQINEEGLQLHFREKLGDAITGAVYNCTHKN